MKTQHPDAKWGKKFAVLALLIPALVLIVGWKADAEAATPTWTMGRLHLPIHLDRTSTLDADWIYNHFPTVSIGPEQLWIDSKHRSVYIKLTRTDRAGLPETAYSHDADGRRVRDKARPELFVGNPSSTAWQAHVRRLCSSAINGLDADSCLGDGVGLASYYRMVTRPVAADGHELTRSEWVARLVGMLESMRPLHVVANTAGWESPTVAAAAWARSVEGNPETPERYEETMLDSRAWITAYTHGPERLAKFLLYAGAEDRFAYWARDRAQPVAWLRHYTMRIGSPAEETVTTTDNVVRRRYTTGYVVWNASARMRIVDLGRRYQDVNGNTARTVTLQPGDARIYRLAP